jgi:hypothetical protein
MKRDYTRYWRLPEPLPPGPAYYEGLSLVGVIVALVVVMLVFGFGA